MSVQSTKPITVKGTFYGTSSGHDTVGNIGLSPLMMDARLIAVSDNFQEFRFKSVSIKLWHENDAPPHSLALVAGYTPVLPTSNPTYSELCSLPGSMVGNGEYGFPTPNLKLNRKLLHQQLTTRQSWFRRGTSFDDLLETQGYLWYSWFGGSLFDVEPISYLVTYECELRGFIASDLTSRSKTSSTTERKLQDPSDDGVLVEKAGPSAADLQQQIDCLSRMLGAQPCAPVGGSVGVSSGTPKTKNQ
jgi:hypothetical protein